MRTVYGHMSCRGIVGTLSRLNPAPETYKSASSEPYRGLKN